MECKDNREVQKLDKKRVSRSLTISSGKPCIPHTLSNSNYADYSAVRLSLHGMG